MLQMRVGRDQPWLTEHELGRKTPATQMGPTSGTWRPQQAGSRDGPAIPPATVRIEVGCTPQGATGASALRSGSTRRRTAPPEKARPCCRSCRDCRITWTSAYNLVQLGPREPVAEAPAHARDATVAAGQMLPCSRNVPVADSAHAERFRHPYLAGRPDVRGAHGAAQGGASLAEAAQARRSRPAEARGGGGRRSHRTLRHLLCSPPARARPQHAGSLARLAGARGA